MRRPASARSAEVVGCGGKAVRADLGDAAAHLLTQAGDAHGIEFVEVAGRDRDEAQPLEQRMALGLLEDAGVELQPAELAVEETFWRVGEGRGDADMLVDWPRRLGSRLALTRSAFRIRPIVLPSSPSVFGLLAAVVSNLLIINTLRMFCGPSVGLAQPGSMPRAISAARADRNPPPCPAFGQFRRQRA